MEGGVGRPEHPIFLRVAASAGGTDLLFGNVNGNVDRNSIGNHEMTETPAGPEITIEG